MIPFVRLAGAAVTAAALFVLLPGVAFAAGPKDTLSPTVQPVQDQLPPAPPTPQPALLTPPPPPGQVDIVPVGPADTGGGGTAPGSSDMLVLLGGLGLAGVAGAGTLVVIRRRAA